MSSKDQPPSRESSAMKEFQSFLRMKSQTRKHSIDHDEMEGKMYETEKLPVQDFDTFVLGQTQNKPKK